MRGTRDILGRVGFESSSDPPMPRSALVTYVDCGSDAAGAEAQTRLSPGAPPRMAGLRSRARERRPGTIRGDPGDPGEWVLGGILNE